jgi:hypothetical protein
MLPSEDLFPVEQVHDARLAAALSRAERRRLTWAARPGSSLKDAGGEGHLLARAWGLAATLSKRIACHGKTPAPTPARQNGCCAT